MEYERIQNFVGAPAKYRTFHDDLQEEVDMSPYQGTVHRGK